LVLASLLSSVCFFADGFTEKFGASDEGQLVMPDADIVRQLTSVSYTLDGASAVLNRVAPECLDLSSDQSQSQW